LKVEQLRGSYPSGLGGEVQPSKSVKESWFEMIMQNYQEQESSRSMIRGKYSNMILTEMAGIAYVLEGVANRWIGEKPWYQIW
jgi:hypothetical protein